MRKPNDVEQYLLEQINYARLAPAADFDRYLTSIDPPRSDDADIANALAFFEVSGKVLARQVAELEPAPPLAWNARLADAALGHGRALIETDSQSHTIGNSTIAGRVEAAGYAFRTVGENIFSYAESALYAHAAFMVDWGATDTGIQEDVGHRVNILNPAFRETGIVVLESTDPAKRVGPYVVTQNFGSRGDNAEATLLGAVRRERDGDGFYSPGEGTGGVKVRVAGDGADVTPRSGGYAVESAAGAQRIVFSGDRLERKVKVEVLLGPENAKLDLVDGESLASSVSLELGRGATHAAFIAEQGEDLTGNGAGNRLTGNGLDNRLFGLGRDDTLDGGDGDDTLDGGAGDDRLEHGAGRDEGHGGQGDDRLEGGAGNDTLSGERGADSVTGGPGDDLLLGGGNDDRVIGGTGDDEARGGQGDDAIALGPGNDTGIGGAGNDVIAGDIGADLLEGGAGKDSLVGGRGGDTLDGGAGRDLLRGEQGNDVFIFEGDFGRDSITGWQDGDSIVLRSEGEAADRAELRTALSEVATGVRYDHEGDGRNVILFLGASLEDVAPGAFDLG